MNFSRMSEIEHRVGNAEPIDYSKRLLSPVLTAAILGVIVPMQEIPDPETTEDAAMFNLIVIIEAP